MELEDFIEEKYAGDEEYESHVLDCSNEVKTLVQSSNAPEFESAFSMLYIGYFEVGDREENSTKSSRITALYIGNDNVRRMWQTQYSRTAILVSLMLKLNLSLVERKQIIQIASSSQRSLQVMMRILVLV